MPTVLSYSCRGRPNLETEAPSKHAHPTMKPLLKIPAGLLALAFFLAAIPSAALGAAAPAATPTPQHQVRVSQSGVVEINGTLLIGVSGALGNAINLKVTPDREMLKRSLQLYLNGVRME